MAAPQQAHNDPAWVPRLAAVHAPAAFTESLRRLKRDCGRSVKAIATRGEIAVGTVQSLVSDQPRVPKWSSVEGFLKGCGVVEEDLRRLWQDAYDRAYPIDDAVPARTLPRLDGRLRTLLTAQWEDAHRHRYQFFDGYAPTLPRLYVAQRSEPSGPDSGIDADTVSGSAQAFSVRGMLERSRNVLVLASPGMGKSTMVNQIQYGQADWWLSDPAGDRVASPFGDVVPVTVPAALLVERSLAGAVNEVCERLRCEPAFAAGEVEAPLPGVPWLVMVDGLDEVLTSYDRARVLSRVVSWIRRPQPHLRFLLASRPLMIAELAELRALRIDEYRLRKFDDADLRTFAACWIRSEPRTPPLRTHSGC